MPFAGILGFNALSIGPSSYSFSLFCFKLSLCAALRSGEMILCSLSLVQGVLFHVPHVKGILLYFWHKVQNIPFLGTLYILEPMPVPTKPMLLMLQACFCHTERNFQLSMKSVRC
jgi:hypothetical protein